MPRLTLGMRSQSYPCGTTQGKAHLVESVSRGEVEILQGSNPRPGTPSILDTVAVGCFFIGHVGCWVSLMIWGKLSIDRERLPLKVPMNSHTSLCQLLIYQLMLQQLAIRVIRTEGENRRAWRKTPRVIGVPPTNFPHHLTILPRQTLDIILSLLHTSDIASQASSLRPVCTLLLAYASLRLVGTKDISGGVYLFLGKVTCLGIKLALFSRENSHENIEFSLFCTKWPYLIEK